MRRIIFVIFILTTIKSPLLAQKFTNGINMGFNVGSSRLLVEVPRDFSYTVNEFSNQSGLALDFEISKLLGDHWELGIKTGFSNLSGKSEDSNFSAEGWHASMMSEIDKPVEYTNKLTGQVVFVGYYFSAFDEKPNFEPFVRLGIGYDSYESKLRYSDPNDGNPQKEGLIFGKTIDGYPNLTTMVYSFQTGIRHKISSLFYINTTLNLNYVNYDFLDVVHNYDIHGNNLRLKGIYSELKVGIFFNTAAAASGSSRKGYRRHKAYKRPVLPFAK